MATIGALHWGGQLSVSQLLTVTGADGDDVDNGAGIAYSIVTAAATVSNGSDADYDGLNTADVAVNNLAVNDAPVLDTPQPLTIAEDAGATTVSLTGIGSGQSGESQTLTVTASSSNANLFQSTLDVTYTSPDSTATLSFTPQNNVSGSAVITLTVSDSGGTANGGVDSSEVSFLLTITPVNDAPTVDINGNGTPGDGLTPNPVYTEGNVPVVVVSPLLRLGDVDSATLVSAAATLSPVPDGDAEVLSVTVGTTGITASYNSATGVLAMSTATPLSLAQWEAVLATLSYQNTSGDPDETNRTVSLVVNDGAATSAADTVTLEVDGVPFAPVVDLNGADFGEDFSVSHPEGIGGVQVAAAGMTVSDADSATLTGAAISISNLLDVGAEQLSASTGGTAITATYVAPTLTLSGTATLAEYQAVLRTVAYIDGSEDPTPGNRLVTVTVTDGSNSSVLRTSTISVSASNDAPIVTVNTGTSLGIGSTVDFDRSALDATDADDPQAGLAFVVVLAPNLGQLQLDGTPLGAGSSFTWSQLDAGNRLRYVHGGLTAGNDGFAFRASDGSDLGDLELFAITVTGLVPPSVTLSDNSTLTYIENAAAMQVDGSVSCTDSDSPTLNGGSVTISIASGGDGSEVLAIGGGIPAIAITGSTVTHGGTAIGTWAGGSGGNALVVSLSSNAATPATVQDLLRAITFRSASENPSSATRGVSLVVNDGGVDSSAAVRTIVVSPVNDAPTVGFSTVQTVPTLARNQQLAISDAENDDTSAAIATPPVKGTLTLDSASGAFTYTAFPGVGGADSFQVTVTDIGSPAESTTVTVPVEIADLGDTAPVIANNPPMLAIEEQPLLWTPVVAGLLPGSTPVYELLGLDGQPGLVFSSGDGTISWSAVPMPSGGYHEFSILVTDPVNLQTCHLPILLLVVPAPTGGG